MSVRGITGGGDEVTRASTDGEAWQALVDRHVALVHGVCEVHRLPAPAAEEVGTLVWLRLAEHLPRLRRPETVGAWIAATTRLQCLRTLGDGAGLAPSPGIEPPARDPAPRDIPVRGASAVEERDGSLLGALAALQPVERAVLRLRAIVPRPTHVEVGAALGLALGDVVAAEQRAVAHVRASVPPSSVWRVEAGKVPGADGGGRGDDIATVVSGHGR